MLIGNELYLSTGEFVDKEICRCCWNNMWETVEPHYVSNANCKRDRNSIFEHNWGRGKVECNDGSSPWTMLRSKYREPENTCPYRMEQVVSFMSRNHKEKE